MTAVPPVQRSKSSSTTSTNHDITTLLNRTSVALARSQRLVDSWLPSPSTTTPDSHDSRHRTPDTPLRDKDKADDGDLQTLLATVGRSDKAGLGYVDPAGVGAGANGAGMSRGGDSELDKLRKQMLGKKGAKLQVQAQAQTQRGGRGGLLGTAGIGRQQGNGESAANGAVGKRKGRDERHAGDDESDDEGGRSAAFKSKRRKGHVGASNATTPVSKPLVMTGNAGQADVVHENRTNGEATTVTGSAPKMTKVEALKDDGDEDGEENDGDAVPKQKPTSYLDEILSQRKTKKKKKKNRNKNKEGSQPVDVASAAPP